MEDRKPPSWEEIHELIARVDDVCRESEHLRARADRRRHQPPFWPERRRTPRHHGEHGHTQRSRGGDITPEGSEGQL